MPIVHQNDGIDPEGVDGRIDCVDDIRLATMCAFADAERGERVLEHRC
jgi:hypothetical protein